MNSVVISQPMFFPWVGMIEQIRLCDVFVHYDDVQFSKGSFFNRVQIKTPNGISWLTVPLKDVKLGQNINETLIDSTPNWRRKHLDLLKQSYAKAPFKTEMLELVSSVYDRGHCDLAQFSADSIETVCRYFGLDQGREFLWSSQLDVPGESTDRVLAIVQQLGGQTYVTGHGARHYFGHELAESLGISIEVQLPNGGYAVAQNADHGVPMAEGIAKNALRKEIAKLAKSVHQINKSDAVKAKA